MLFFIRGGRMDKWRVCSLFFLFEEKPLRNGFKELSMRVE